jgi:SAM-dependent methyltransferase
MNDRETYELIASAVPPDGGTWADFGAGAGHFTKALAEWLGDGTRIYAVDVKLDWLPGIRSQAARSGAEIVVVQADLEQPFELPGAERGELDGFLMANTLHFMPDRERVLARLVEWLRPGGHAIIVEYENRAASEWVPYPVTPALLGALFAASGLSAPRITAKVQSMYGGRIYVAAGTRGA